ncbi:MAG TPA: type III PLP-dependent enzyme [Pseudonocardiaceae bacterium]
MCDLIRQFLDGQLPPTPCLVMDLDAVRAAYRRLRAVLPEARVYYATKANPDLRVLATLAELGAGFDVASPAEVALCLAAGAEPESISYGSTVKKRSDVAYAFGAGVRRFAVDSPADLENIAAAAPGSQVYCRIFVPDDGARTPFGRKFGCSPAEAAELLRAAGRLGLAQHGVSFHVGSQQLDPAAFARGVAAAADVAGELAGTGVPLPVLNLGGGFPVRYAAPVPPVAAYTSAIRDAVRRHFPHGVPSLAIEPGRILVAEAGVLRTEVVLVAERDDRRWVYLDVGRYGGLAETENEAIAYRIVSRRGGPDGPVVLAGPTCDGDDVLYQRTPYRLPLSLRGGDTLDILAAGAYTASYSSVAFNGFPPLPTYCVGEASKPSMATPDRDVD